MDLPLMTGLWLCNLGEFQLTRSLKLVDYKCQVTSIMKSLRGKREWLKLQSKFFTTQLTCLRLRIYITQTTTIMSFQLKL